MSDPVSDSLLTLLADLRAKKAKAERRAEQAAQEVRRLSEEEGAVLKSIELLGLTVPDSDPALVKVTAYLHQAPTVTALDAARAVVEVGEVVTPRDVANRVDARRLPIASKNPANAIATAMARSTAIFEPVGPGKFKRLPPLSSNAWSARSAARILEEDEKAEGD